MALRILTDGGEGNPNPLFIHAHSDDETLQTGALLAWLASQQVSCDLVTCTRGEQGQIVPGALPKSITDDDLVRVRGRELACAVAALDITSHYWLGTPPARAAGLSPRNYRDSGMTWVEPGLAGPAELDDPLTFTAAELAEATADLVALVRATEPSVLVGYDDAGSYGHPDHLRAHEITVAAARETGVLLVEVASNPDDPGFEWFDFSEQREMLMRALRCHATQLTVHDDHLVHVGGQRQEMPLRVGLRVADLG